MKFCKRLILSLMVSFVAITSQAKADIINGNFETGDFTGWTQFGDTSFTGVLDSSFSAPHSGDFAAWFGPVNGIGGIEQTVSLAPGSYVLDFWLQNFGFTPTEFQVSIGGNLVFDLVDSDPFDFTHFSFKFEATGPTTISFGFFHPPSYFGLDDIHITSAVPAPPAVLLAGIGVLSLLGRRIGRKQTA